ncbi:hypothetical protein BDF22DRAFT_743259 [Syncephalis plumigaleata]|nr:hypothetical protein BDF22DRAFT_743259 [Syncephalis plumigaleata]
MSTNLFIGDFPITTFAQKYVEANKGTLELSNIRWGGGNGELRLARVIWKQKDAFMKCDKVPDNPHQSHIINEVKAFNALMTAKNSLTNDYAIGRENVMDPLHRFAFTENGPADINLADPKQMYVCHLYSFIGGVILKDYIKASTNAQAYIAAAKILPDIIKGLMYLYNAGILYKDKLIHNVMLQLDSGRNVVGAKIIDLDVTEVFKKEDGWQPINLNDQEHLSLNPRQRYNSSDSSANRPVSRNPNILNFNFNGIDIEEYEIVEILYKQYPEAYVEQVAKRDLTYKNHSIPVSATFKPLENSLLVTLINIPILSEEPLANLLETELLKYGELLDLRLTYYPNTTFLSPKALAFYDLSKSPEVVNKLPKSIIFDTISSSPMQWTTFEPNAQNYIHTQRNSYEGSYAPDRITTTRTLSSSSKPNISEGSSSSKTTSKVPTTSILKSQASQTPNSQATASTAPEQATSQSQPQRRRRNRMRRRRKSSQTTNPPSDPWWQRQLEDQYEYRLSLLLNN